MAVSSQGQSCPQHLTSSFLNFLVVIIIGNFPVLGNQVSKSLFFEPTDEREVFAVCQTLKNTTSLDSCNIQSRPVKYVLPIIMPCLTYITYIIPRSLQQFSVDTQVARVAVIYKKGDKNNLGNYRPISILPFFSKGSERIIHRRLQNVFRKHSVINDCQYGFTEYRSTEHALLDQKEYILNNLELCH